MFVFRKISQSGVEMNFNLGNSYTLIIEEHHPKEFKEVSAKDEVLRDEVYYGFIIRENGGYLYLSKKQENYIMTDSGNTFANITYKN